MDQILRFAQDDILRILIAMESWDDQGVVLAARPHGEGGAIISLLTEHHGRHAGFVHGAQSTKKRALVEPGTHVGVHWNARNSDNLGTYALEQEGAIAPRVMQDRLRLGALLSACAICDAALPEREGHAGLYHGLQALLGALDSGVWGAAYVMWEIALLKELGFGLDLTRCAGGGDDHMLAYVSPKTGRAVSYEAGEPYKEKLLDLPAFLKPNGGPAEDEDVAMGVKMTGYFMEHWVFAQATKGVPEPRVRFGARMEKITTERTEETQRA